MKEHPMILHGREIPYDDNEDGEAEPEREWAHAAARGILADLLDRRSIKTALRSVEEAETRKEIVDAIRDIILSAAGAAPGSSKYAVGQLWLLKSPAAAASYLAESLATVEGMRSDLQRHVEMADEDDPWVRLNQIREDLREMDHHLTGTSIGLAMDFGAWHTKDGWEPASSHPLLQD
jgi:hypothetical protein